MLREGELVDGRYLVEARLGQGGLAEVYRVRHRDLGSEHALKVLTWRRKSLMERMLLEGRIQAQLRHPHIVAVTDILYHDGRCALLMEYVDGTTLEGFLAQRGALSLSEALPLMAPIMAAVTAAHDAGVLHRDLKPANVLLARSSVGLIPKVADFGIAKIVVDDMAPGATAVGSLMGSPGYLAPEQVVDSGTVDLRADIFALGAILYEMLAGHRAFPGVVDEISARAAAGQRPPPLHIHRPDCPPRLSEALARAMEPERDQRYPDCRAFARDLFADAPELLAMVDRPQLSAAFSLQLQPLPAPPLPAPPLPAAATLPAVPTIDPALHAYPTVVPPTLAAPTLTVSPPPPRSALRPVLLALLLGAIGGGGALWALWPPASPLPPGPAVVIVAPPVPATPAPTPTPAEPPLNAIITPLPQEPSPSTSRSAPSVVPSVGGAETPTPTAPSLPEAPVAAVAEAEMVAPVEAVVVAPSPTEVTPPEQAPPAPISAEAVAGVWRGTANKLPFQMRIRDRGEGQVSAELTFYQGPSQRTATAVGRYEPSTGTLMLRSDDEGLVFEGSLKGGRLSGSYQLGGRSSKSLPWDVSRD